MSPSEETAGDLLLDEAAATVVMADPSDLGGVSGVSALLTEAAQKLREEGDGEGARQADALSGWLAAALSSGDDGGEVLNRLSAGITEVQRWRAGPRELPAVTPEASGGSTATSSPSADAPPESAPAGGKAFDAETVVLIGEFLGEASEGLATADEILLTVEQDGQEPEKVNALFRVFHTIKGVSGFLGLPDVTTLAHTTENLMNQVREGKARLEGPNLEAMFAATGEMRKYLDEVRRAVESDSPVGRVPSADAVLAELRACIAAASDGEAAPAKAAPKAVPAEEAELFVDAPAVVEAAPVVPLAPSAVDVPTPSLAVPPRAATPVTTAPVPVAAPPAAIAAPEPKAAPAPKPAQGVNESAAAARAPAAAPAQAAPATPTSGGPARLRETLKIDLERVDSLMELIGELIIVESMVVFAPEIREIPSLQVRKHLTQLSKISRDLQDVAMRMRMVPLRGVFQKMQRLVRELSHKTGKRVSLAISGEGTEMDRSMVERIEDPLVHMLRNAVDHGIESVEDRLRSGKPAEATIRLCAYHEGGSVVIEVGDDGRGLNREAILRRAVERGLIRDGEARGDSEVYALIFAPGFSTAAAVTEISGRGVGMDVVKRTVEDLRGRVIIQSTPGTGSTFRLVLPLTLAIIDGMLVAVGNERYIVPSLSIIESLQPREGMISTYRNSDELINVRGELLPLFRLGKIFDLPAAIEDPCHALVMVVESMGRKVGLLVDDVVSQQQVVIKPVGTGVGQQDSFSGAAILSDGKVGLILNIDRICNAVGVRAQRAGWGSGEMRV